MTVKRHIWASQDLNPILWWGSRPLRGHRISARTRGGSGRDRTVPPGLLASDSEATVAVAPTVDRLPGVTHLQGSHTTPTSRGDLDPSPAPLSHLLKLIRDAASDTRRGVPEATRAAHRHRRAPCGPRLISGTNLRNPGWTPDLGVDRPLPARLHWRTRRSARRSATAAWLEFPVTAGHGMGGKNAGAVPSVSSLTPHDRHSTSALLGTENVDRGIDGHPAAIIRRQ